MTGAPARRRVSLQELLTLQLEAEGVFLAHHSQRNPGGSIFGGALIGQLMMAASQDVAPDRALHHAQMTFLSPGQVGEPVRYETQRLLQGRNFTIVQVLGSQAGRAVVTGQVSFHRPELGPRFQQALAHTPPPPEGLPSLQELVQQHAPHLGDAAQRFKPLASLDIRLMDDGALLFERDPQGRTRYWIKTTEPLPALAAVQASALGFLSDYWFPATAMLPHLGHKVGHGLHVTSLNHALWLHQPVQADDWLYVEAHSPSSGGARGLSLAEVYNRQGQLVATWSQENLFRGWRLEGEDLVTPEGQRA